jgi:imidazolonepropionase-like amidohydrolase
LSYKKPALKKSTARGFKFLTLQVIMAALILTACAPAAPADTPVSPNSYTITGVAVVEVEKGIVLPDQTVVIDDGLIQAVGSRAELSAPTGTHLIDGRGLYLMPGLVDAHVHYFDPEIFGRVMIANGILLVRDMGMPTDYILKLRDELNRGETPGPEMMAAGAMLDGSPPVIPSISMDLKTPEEGRAAVRKQAEAGVDMIKVYSRLDKEVFLAIVDEARKVGLKVVGHVPDSIYIEDAAAAGLRSIEHWFGFEEVIARLVGESDKLNNSSMGSDAGFMLRFGELDPQALQGFYQRLRASGVTVVPTVVTFKNWPNVNTLETQSLPKGEYISPDLLALWKSQWAGQSESPDLLWQNWAQMVKELNKAGVPLMVGTDLAVPGIIPGYSVHEEMAIWQEAGLPPADVLRSATLVPVQFMGLDDRLGTVAEGKAASLVLVKGNPLEDIRNAQLVEAVFLRGKYYDHADLDRLLSEAREAASSSTPSTAVSTSPTASPPPTAAPVPTATPLPTAASLPPLVIDDTWATYTNDRYGFSLRYPAGWTLKEITGPVNTMSGHAVHLLNPTDPTVRLIIAFKRAEEDRPITPTGMGGGELVTRGGVSLLGQEVERIVRVELGKDMAVYYGWPRSAPTGGDLVFWLALDCVCSAGDPAAVGLTPDVEQIADAIVESITLKK